MTEMSIAEETQKLTLDKLEGLIYTRRHAEALMLLVKILQQFEDGAGLREREATEQDPCASLAFYTRFACALSALFSDPALKLDYDGFELLALYGPSIGLIYPCSALRTPSHVLKWTGMQDPDNPNNFRLEGAQPIMKFLLLYSLYADVSPDFSRLFQVAPSVTLPVYLMAMSTRLVCTPTADAKREQLLQLGAMLERAQLTDKLALRLASPWMYCSYAHGERKHEVKRHLNALLRRWMESKGVKAPSLPPRNPQKKRPRLVVAAEIFTYRHAMFRCYAPAIQQLREQFELILVAEERSVSKETKALFERFVAIDYRDQDIRKVVGTLIKLKPDMLYFPSLGMNTWSIALANLRLAPIQLFSLGHPATSHSAEIDYLLMEEIYYGGNPRLYTEKLILTPDRTLQYQHLELEEKVEPDIRVEPEVIKIAIASRSFKISWPFIQACQEINRRARRPIEFHIFPNERGLLYQAIEQEIQQQLPNSVLYPSNSYNGYIQQLNHCDLHFQTFPFGGTNSNADSIRQGIPLLTMEGEEAHSRTDLPFIRFIEMPEWLIAKNQEEYVQAALRLIHNDAERVELSRRLLQSDINAQMFDAEFTHTPQDFVKTFQWLYRHHEQIQASAQRVWTPAEQAALAERKTAQ